MTAAPTLAALAAFLHDALGAAAFPPEERGGVFRPGDGRAVARLGVALEPWPGLAAWAEREALDALFLHRPWRLAGGAPGAGVGVLWSHLPFDERLTTGFNPRLAEALGLAALEPLGEKAGRALGMLGAWAPRPPAEAAALAAAVFGGCEAELPGAGSPVARVAVVGAMTDALVREAAARGAGLYVTGQLRAPARAAADATGVAVLAVGHARSEVWGVRALAHLVAERWGALTVRVAGTAAAALVAATPSVVPAQTAAPDTAAAGLAEVRALCGAAPGPDTRAVFGVVRAPDGTPVPGATVEVRWPAPPGASGSWRTRTLADGRYAFCRLPRGAVTVTAAARTQDGRTVQTARPVEIATSPAGWVAQPLALTAVRADGPPAAVAAAPDDATGGAADTLSLVDGVVFDSAAGRPLRGAFVQFVDPASYVAAATAVTDSLGRYQVGPIRPGAYIVGFMHPALDARGLDQVAARATVLAGAGRLDLAAPRVAAVPRRPAAP
jgi:putative NIF3 family GTP cyclohydrolase 1 type 2/protocatechuate 3,4-dioxygenase beta subunit